MKKLLGASKETTLYGLLTGLTLIFGEVAKQFDNDPATNIEIATIAAAVGMIVAFWRARDQSAHDREKAGQ